MLLTCKQVFFETLLSLDLHIFDKIFNEKPSCRIGSFWLGIVPTTVVTEVTNWISNKDENDALMNMLTRQQTINQVNYKGGRQRIAWLI
jgi:hypothetical protein